MAYVKELSQETVSTKIANIHGNEWTGQLFTTSGAFDATKVEFYTSVETWYNNGQYWTTLPICHIYSVSGGLPNASLGSGTMVFNTGAETTPAWCEAVFDAPISLSATTQYALVIDPVTGGAIDELEVFGAYPGSGGGYVVSVNNGVAWSADARFNLGYKLYSGSDVSYADIAATVTATTAVSGALDTSDVSYADIAATVTATTAISGALDTAEMSSMAGEIAASATISGDLLVAGFPTRSSIAAQAKPRIVAIANNSLYYEDI